MSRPTRTDDASAGLTAANSGMNRRRFLAGTAALAAGGMLMGRPLPAAAQEAPAKGAAARAASSYKLVLGGYAGPELTSQPITLKFMRQEFPPHVNAVLEEAYKEFSAAYPNITIQEEKVPYGDLQKKMQIYVGSGAAPDVMMGRTDFIEAYHAGNIALPLQDYFLDEFLHDILDNQFKAASAKGNFYGAPWETYFTMMYFNRDIFKKAGVPTPPEVTDVNAGWTAEEFIAALDELTQKLRAQGDSTTWALSAATHGNGGPGANYTQVESLWVRSQGDPNADKGSSAYKTFLGVSEDGLQATGYLDTRPPCPTSSCPASARSISPASTRPAACSNRSRPSSGAPRPSRAAASPSTATARIAPSSGRRRPIRPRRPRSWPISATTPTASASTRPGARCRCASR